MICDSCDLGNHTECEPVFDGPEPIARCDCRCDRMEENDESDNVLPVFPQPWVRCIGCGEAVVYYSDEFWAMATVDRPPFSFTYVHAGCPL